MATKIEPASTDPTSERTHAATVVHLALDVAERGQSTAIAILQDARVELRTAVDGGLELVEKLALGAVRFAKKVTHKLDDASNAALAGTERALTTAVKSARAPNRELPAPTA